MEPSKVNRCLAEQQVLSKKLMTTETKAFLSLGLRVFSVFNTVINREDHIQYSLSTQRQHIDDWNNGEN
jgi:hypothetical protein